MKKSTFWVGVFATGLIASFTTACSSTPDDSGPKGGTGGTGVGGGGGAAGTSAGTQLQYPAYIVNLKGADLTVGGPPPAAYTSAGCSSCHAANAEGNTIGPENRFTPKEYAVAVVRGGRKNPDGSASPMAAFSLAALSDADLDAINVWQNSFPKPPTGQGIYLAMCGNCHGPTAGGGSAPIAIMGKSKMLVQMYVRNGNGTDYNLRKEFMPKFDATLLTETDLAAIEGYLGSM